MFDNKRGITGWPSNFASSNKTLTNLNIYEPILYFIQTAQKSLDVAMMVISNNTVANALIKAHRRGISIRIIFDYNYCQRNNSKDLEKSGIQVVYYVCPDQSLSSIMHYKYMLKDYSNGNGYLYTGSQNWTNVSFKEYYENTIFTTDSSVVEAIHNNFEQTWNYVNDLCKTNSYVKARLRGVQ